MGILSQRGKYSTAISLTYQPPRHDPESLSAYSPGVPDSSSDLLFRTLVLGESTPVYHTHFSTFYPLSRGTTGQRSVCTSPVLTLRETGPPTGGGRDGTGGGLGRRGRVADGGGGLSRTGQTPGKPRCTAGNGRSLRILVGSSISRPAPPPPRPSLFHPPFARRLTPTPRPRRSTQTPRPGPPEPPPRSTRLVGADSDDMASVPGQPLGSRSLVEGGRPFHGQGREGATPVDPRRKGITGGVRYSGNMTPINIGAGTFLLLREPLPGVV